MAKPATAILILTVLSVFLHLQTQAAMEGSTSVQEPTSRPRKMAVANARNLVCRSCRCIIAIGVQFERCCYSGSELVSCGCSDCRGN
ncbi:hypothetical protein EJB05_02338 [Eragrostis curvula]|uniref:Uncharacterized protein n=1 Tax=Eragrostis curvula TaxID=38414 RepID=A0A5J9WUF3_9POAL|nr:hypothetical protein EJB05_02338 [Eragrostis curvula]